MSYWDGYPPYVSVGEKRAKAAAKLKKLQKTDPRIQPVILAGSAIAATWWGKSWNRNLERYADYSNRIGRGRSYVRHGAVLDLRIRAGEVTALVQGTRSQPYAIKIEIEKLAPSRWEAVKAACAGRLASLPELLAGKFPRDLGEIFMEEGEGLFPTPQEIRFSCSCPDWAYMCKHVAAALYGIGARLDNDPGLFFTLRGIAVGEMVSAAVTETTQDLLKKAGRQSRRVLTGVDLSDVFGIDLDEGAADLPPKDAKSRKAPGALPSQPVAHPQAKTPAGKRTGRRAVKTGPQDLAVGVASPPQSVEATVPPLSPVDAVPPPRTGEAYASPSRPVKATRPPLPAGAAKKAARKSPPPTREGTLKPSDKIAKPTKGTRKSSARVKKAPASAPPLLELVEQFILKSRKGIDTATLVKKTGLTASQVRNIVQRLRTLGRIATLSRGIYGKVAGRR